MKMTKEYYEANVDMGCEVEREDGSRYWETVKGDKVKAFFDSLDEDEYFSDCDLCCKQSNEKVKAFLNLVDYNATHNPNYKGLGFYKVLEIALDNWDY